jgi:fumarate hydratase class II
VKVPAAAKWAAQTQRAVDNFLISGLTVDRSLIRALAAIKVAVAAENGHLGVLDAEMAAAIATAAAEVAAGEWADQFPVDVFQTGSGTSTNMNVNEVVATLAAERLGRPVHPNDDVNRPLSSNDMFPSAVHIAAAVAVTRYLIPSLAGLSAALRAKQTEFAAVVKAGRTHLMDATPVTLGQEFGGYARAVELGVERLTDALPRLRELPLGGTAVGTGINAPPGFAAAVIAGVVAATGVDFVEAGDHFEAQGGRDALVETSGVLRTVALGLYKLANDLRWMNSGPRCGLGEIRVPELQPGSSIMPGKVNPVVPEAVCQVVAQVVGNDAAVAFGGSAGAFELNVMVPVMARNLLESIGLLGSVAGVLADRCVAGIQADEERCRAYALASPAIATALAPMLGYERVAEIVQESVATGRDLRAIVQQRGWLTDDELDRALDVLAMTRGGTA